ncbi:MULTISPECIES: citramalate synthase [unclassified Schaalia]|uniref:citramalate synthase n=1 Tax=unclassified Schaalia TaxID=2691889 RepID=UPI001E639B5C|nr:MULTISPECIES: citramalate synthase [unclassified Schaalia]MCD4549274.1 citramalate synthase [Schaalia sp. lx-260]MCD4557083.1 citramalate synthase [Schaalia sp. lx-100]
MPAEHVALYDTTLRDGAQQEGISLSVADKIAIVRILDDLGVDYVEGGWPGAIPKDTEFFQQAATMTLRRTHLVAFGSTARPGLAPSKDQQVCALRDCGVERVTLVAKSDPRHVKQALRTSCAENLRMVHDTVAFLTQAGHEVMVDLEHFFDGLAEDTSYGFEVIRAAVDAGASTVIACDTNGGNLPDAIAHYCEQTRMFLDDIGAQHVVLGIHAHNDTGCAVANSLAAVNAGVRHVQGTINGYGERTGNTNLLTCAANLELKMPYTALPAGHLSQLEHVSHRVAELVNITPYARDPYVGRSAFAHKAGLHASAIRVNPDLYQHIDPVNVGNDMRMVVSEMAGRASIELKARECGLDLSKRPEVSARVAIVVKEREAQGYTFDVADASFELLVRKELGKLPRFVRVESWKVMTQEIAEVQGEPFTQSEATVKVHTDTRHIRTAEGNGPVNALDRALRHVLTRDYPVAASFALTDFKVRILEDPHAGTDATTRVLVTMGNGKRQWTTVGVGTDVIEASWEALFDAYWWGLLAAGATSLLEE